MTQDKHGKHFNVVGKVIHLYEDEGLTQQQIALQLRISLKQVDKIIRENCNYYED